MESIAKHSFVTVISCILESVTIQQDNFSATAAITPFTALCKPKISIRDYIERILKYSNCSIECLVLALIYIDRLIQSGRIPVNSLTIHRILITSILIAIKFFDDTFCTNSYYARIGGIQTKEMNHLEMEFLKGVNFSLLVSCADYHKYHNELYLHAHNGLCHLCYRSPLPSLCYSEHSKTLIYSWEKSATNSPRNIVDACRILL